MEAYLAMSAQQNNPVRNVDTIAGKIDAFGDVISRLGNIAGSTERIADVIAGTYPQPPNDKTNPPTPVPNGLGDHIGHFLQNLSMCMDRIERALNRVDKAIG